MSYNRRNNKFGKYELDELKQGFIRQLKEEGVSEVTFQSYENTLNRIVHFEKTKLKNKTIEQATIKEFKSFVKSLDSSTLLSLKNQLGFIKRYIEYLETYQGVRDVEFKEFITSKEVEKFVNKDKYTNRYVSKKELESFVHTLCNPSDRALLLCLFEGIRGRKNCELTNLKIGDLDLKEHIVYTKNENGEVKQRKISTELSSELASTVEEDKYWNKNGFSTSVARDIEEFVESEHVFRPTKMYLTISRVSKMIDEGFYDGKSLSESALSSKITKCLKEYCGKEHVTPITLYHSGIMWRFLEKYYIGGSVMPSKLDFINFAEEEGVETVTAYSIYKKMDALLPKFVEEIE